MTAIEAYARLLRIGSEVIETADAAASLRTSSDAAGKTLRRLEQAGVARRLFHGLWALGDRIDPLLLPERLTAPFPAYVSLQTALYHHGLISQIPAVITAVTLGRTRRLRTAVGAFSIHHLAREVFGGFEVTAAGVKLATAEKALFDVLYLSGKRTREFSALPELDVPRGFRWTDLLRWLERVTSVRDRTLVARRISRLRPVGRPAARRRSS